MNYIDYAIVATVAFFTVKGLVRGVLQETFGFIGLIISLIIATKFMSNASAWLDKIFDIPPTLSTVLGFLVIFIALILATQTIIHFLRKLARYSFLGWLEKLVGGMVGFLKGGIITSLLLIFISLVPFGNQLIPGQKDSLLFEPTKNFAPHMFNVFMTIVPNSKSFYAELKESLRDLNVGEKTQDFLQSLNTDDQPQNDKQ
jgi:membrane protein required for colicin V production